jgi:uncharacterized membrane protein YuzA (DUF378 family)
MHYIGLIAYVLVVFGALNWGLVGAFGIDVVSRLLGSSLAAKIVYILIGVSGIIMIVR